MTSNATKALGRIRKYMVSEFDCLSPEEYESLIEELYANIQNFREEAKNERLEFGEV